MFVCKFRFKVDGSSWSKQLPTIITFENGKEKMRRPYVDYKGTVQKFFFTEVSCLGPLEESATTV